jgi:chromosome segregation ATPase
MQAPIVKLRETYESLEKELKGLQERESGANAELDKILTQMDELKAEAEGAHLRRLSYFLDSTWFSKVAIVGTDVSCIHATSWFNF